MPLALLPFLPYIGSVLGKLTLRDCIYLVAVLAVISGCVYLWVKGEEHGKAVVTHQIERQNDAAAKAANGAGLDVDQCYNAGLRWNQSTGNCER